MSPELERLLVWQVLDALGRGESADEIVAAWDGKISKGAIAEIVPFCTG